MKHGFLIFFFLLFATLKGFTQQAVFKIGDQINLSKANLLSPKNEKIATDKLIVIEFWATWCAPCIASFPYLESIQKEFENEIQILAITDENETKVNNFLKKKNYMLSFFLDKDKTLFNSFNIESRPLTCILSSERKLLWVGETMNLKAVLSDYIKFKTIHNDIHINEINKKYYDVNRVDEKPCKSILDYNISISNPDEEYFVQSQKNEKINSPIAIKYKAVSVSEVIQDLKSVKKNRYINCRIDLDTILVNITAKSSSKTFSYNSMSGRIIDDLEKTFDFSIKEQLKEVELYQMKIVDFSKLNKNIEETEGGGMVEKKVNTIKVSRLNLNQIADYIETKMKSYIRYDGELNTKYNLSLTITDSFEDLKKELEEKYGITFEKKIEKITFTEIK